MFMNETGVQTDPKPMTEDIEIQTDSWLTKNTEVQTDQFFCNESLNSDVEEEGTVVLSPYSERNLSEDEDTTVVYGEASESITIPFLFGTETVESIFNLLLMQVPEIIPSVELPLRPEIPSTSFKLSSIYPVSSYIPNYDGDELDGYFSS